MNSSSLKANSVRNEWKLLKQVVEAPGSILEPVRTDLLSALQSQAGLALLELPDYGIVGMSLNTHKAVATACIEGGYSAVNDYRKAALVRLKSATLQSKRPGRGTLDWHRDELADKTEKLSRITNEVAKMGQQLQETLQLCYEMAQAAGKESEFIKRRNELLRKFQ